MSAVCAFQRKLEVFTSDLQVSLFCHTHSLDSNEHLSFMKCSSLIIVFLPTGGTVPLPKTFGTDQRRRTASESWEIPGEADVEF
jgi:hypothetical protein